MGKTLTCIFWGLTVAATCCQAQSAQWQFLPDIDAYWTMNPTVRVEALIERTKDGDTFNSATVGSGINFFVKPLSSKRRTNKDMLLDDRNRLELRIINGALLGVIGTVLLFSGPFKNIILDSRRMPGPKHSMRLIRVSGAN